MDNEKNLISRENLRWILNYYQANGYDERFRAYERWAFKSKDGDALLNILRTVKEADFKAYEKAILQSDSLRASMGISFMKGADITAHQNKTIYSRNPSACYSFARNIRGIDPIALGRPVIESQDQYMNYLFARDIKGADIVGHAVPVFRGPRDDIKGAYIHQVRGVNTPEFTTAMGNALGMQNYVDMWNRCYNLSEQNPPAEE